MLGVISIVVMCAAIALWIKYDNAEFKKQKLQHDIDDAILAKKEGRYPTELYRRMP